MAFRTENDFSFYPYFTLVKENIGGDTSNIFWGWGECTDKFAFSILHAILTGEGWEIQLHFVCFSLDATKDTGPL